MTVESSKFNEYFSNELRAVRQDPIKYKKKGGWKSRKPVQVSAKTHADLGILMKLGLSIGSTRGEVIETAVALLKKKHDEPFQSFKRVMRQKRKSLAEEAANRTAISANSLKEDAP